MDYKAMFEQTVATLAAIDEALGLDADGCEPDFTLDAIEELKKDAARAAAPSPSQAEPVNAELTKSELTDEEIDQMADDFEDSIGNVRADKVIYFARAIIPADRAKRGEE